MSVLAVALRCFPTCRETGEGDCGTFAHGSSGSRRSCRVGGALNAARWQLDTRIPSHRQEARPLRRPAVRSARTFEHPSLELREPWRRGIGRGWMDTAGKRLFATSKETRFSLSVSRPTSCGAASLHGTPGHVDEDPVHRSFTTNSFAAKILRGKNPCKNQRGKW